MSNEVWFDRLADLVASSGINKYAAPLAGTSTSGVTFRQFGPFDAGNGDWQFSKGLRVEMPNGSTSDSLFAMTTGSVAYLKAADGAPGKLVLTRGDVAPTATARQIGALPAWYPQPTAIIYENVDSGEARSAILAVLQDQSVAEGVRVRIRRATRNPNYNGTPDEIADLWMDDKVGEGVPVKGGTKIGGCGISTTAATLEATVKIVDNAFSPALFYNPSYYIALWDSLGWIPSGNTLLPLQSNTVGPVVGNGKIIFVKQTGSDTSPFATPATASKTIQAAINVANKNDTVLILDTGTYPEEVVITEGITLMSTSNKKATDSTAVYPRIDGNGSRRPLRISSVSDGIAHVSHLAILNGIAEHNEHKGAGGGVLIWETPNVAITSCMIKDCNAYGGGIFAEGYGGGIGSYHSSPAIVGCLLERNHGAGRGSGIGAWGYGWPTIFDCTLRGNRPPDSVPQPPNPFDPFGRKIRGDGGGIAITIAVPTLESADGLSNTTREQLPSRWDQDDLKRARKNWARIQNCTIEGNRAYDDGGGVFISIASNVRITGGSIQGNQATNDGGGIRVTMRSELIVINANISNNESNVALQTDNKAGGGGVSSRNCTNVKLRGVTINHNHANGWAGGGTSFISSDEGDFVRNWLGKTPPNFDWNDILLHPQIFAFNKAELEIDPATTISNNMADRVPGQDQDHGKGGGLYVLRWNGPRSADRVSPTILAQPIDIKIGNAPSLQLNNSASFPQSNRIFLEDQSISPPLIKRDPNLPGGSFRYPAQ